MASIFRPSTLDDEAGIIDLLDRVFSPGQGHPLLNPAHLRWKYREPRADCSDPRSYVIEKDGAIVAHGGFWPATVQTPSGIENGGHVIDWVASPQTPGVGVSLLQRIARRYDFIYAIGGSDMTQSILPKFGFRVDTQAFLFARPLRPWRQILHHQTRDARLPLRVARNVAWSLLPAGGPGAGWSATEVNPDEVDVSGGEAGGTHGPDFLHYLCQCPVAGFRVFRMLHHGKNAGYFVLAVVARQARLVGAALPEPTLARWVEAIQLARQAALLHTDAIEFVLRASDPTAVQGAVQAGMRLRGQAPVFLLRRDGGQAPYPLLGQLWDNDGAFLGGSKPEFLT